jgi:hypothetical protein
VGNSPDGYLFAAVYLDNLVRVPEEDLYRAAECNQADRVAENNPDEYLEEVLYLSGVPDHMMEACNPSKAVRDLELEVEPEA